MRIRFSPVPFSKGAIIMLIFNIYRSGYEAGFSEGRDSARQRADWELVLTKVVSWLPGVDARSYREGYQKDSSNAIAARHLLPELRRQRAHRTILSHRACRKLPLRGPSRSKPS